MTAAQPPDQAAAATPAEPGPWRPFAHRAFATLWAATLLSNIGTWMSDVGSGWLMTTLAPGSALMVALVQTATTLPIFLLALPAGAVADIVDRRRLLVAVNIALAIIAATLAVLVAAEAMTAPLLLMLTFLMGAGAAFMAPAWQSIVPMLVPRGELPAAIALNSLGINIARAIGPAVAGVLITAVGIAAPFVLNALSFLGIIAALILWRPPPRTADGPPPERLLGAMRIGLAHAAASPPLQRTLVRAVAFFVFGSAFWALMPLIARTVLAGGAALYGTLLTLVGAGAVAGALVLPRLRARLSPDRVVAGGTIGMALAQLLLAVVSSTVVAGMAAVIAGASWISVLSSLNMSAQGALPDWVRARGLSIYLTVFFGSMALGSVIWGNVADLAGVEVALLAAAAGAVLVIPLTWAARLTRVGGGQGLAPSAHWPQPLVADGVETQAPGGRDRPVRVVVSYRVPAANHQGFRRAMAELRAARRRDGAHGWRLWQDAAQPELFVETFEEASWAGHLRHHARVSHQDQALQAAVAQHLTPGTQPEVRHLLGV